MTDPSQHECPTVKGLIMFTETISPLTGSVGGPASEVEVGESEVFKNPKMDHDRGDQHTGPLVGTMVKLYAPVTGT